MSRAGPVALYPWPAGISAARAADGPRLAEAWPTGYHLWHWEPPESQLDLSFRHRWIPWACMPFSRSIVELGGLERAYLLIVIAYP